MPTNFENRSKDEISSEINNTNQEIEELNEKLRTQNGDEKKEIQKSINKNEAYLQALKEALKEKESNEQTLNGETTAMLLDLKETRATQQIKQGLQAADIEGQLFDESKNPNYDTVKKYLQHLMEKSSNQSSFIQTLNDEGGGCWSSCIQIALNNLGHYKQGEKNHIDGIIGTDTKSATRRFQEDYNQKHNYKEGDENRLKPDSIPGYKTTKALLEELEKTDNSDSVSDTPTGSTTRIESGASNPNNPTATVNHNKTEDEIIEGTIEENEYKTKINEDTYKYLISKGTDLLKDYNLHCYDGKVNGGYYQQSTNPEFTVTSIASTGMPILETFNFNQFIKDGTLQEQQFINTIRNKMDQKSKEYQELQEDRINANQFANTIRGKKYSAADLGLDSSANNIAIGAFFNQFSDNKLLIDWQTGCTYFDDKVLHLQLNKKGRNNKERCKQEILKKDLKNKNGDYNEEKLKEQLKIIVENIANEYFSKHKADS